MPATLVPALADATAFVATIANVMATIIAAAAATSTSIASGWDTRSTTVSALLAACAHEPCLLRCVARRAAADGRGAGRSAALAEEDARGGAARHQVVRRLRIKVEARWRPAHLARQLAAHGGGALQVRTCRGAVRPALRRARRRAARSIEAGRGELRGEDGAWRPVAVKVLHPGVREFIDVDMDLLRGVGWLLQQLPKMKWLNPAGMLDEFANLLLMQLDLTLE